MQEEIVVGIDLGTTNTLACYMKKGKPELVRFPGSKKLLPSVLYVEKETGKIVVGEKAKKQGILDPLNRIRSSKTYMGDFAKTWTCYGKTFTPTEVAIEILQEVKEGIKRRTKCSDDAKISAVITVPAYFNSNQTDETRKAGEAAGFRVLQIITEPMAAAVAAVKELELNEKIFVVDLGGGTFDLSVLEADQANHSYRALDIDGDRHLGGDDFDELLYQHFLRIIEDDLGLDLSSEKASGLVDNEYYSMTGRVHDAAEIAKIDLSEHSETEINISNLFTYNGKNYDFEYSLTRSEFDEICGELYEKIFSRIQHFVKRSHTFSLEDLETIILAGGSCYIPKIQQEMTNIFHQSVDTQMDRSTLVVIGACFVAEAESGGLEIQVQDVISHSLGVETVTPDGRLVLTKMLKKGEVYPCESKKLYTTTLDNQTEIPIHVYEAGSDQEFMEETAYHDFYGGLVLEGIEIAPKGEPGIEVTFQYDKSRCLTVIAEDQKTKVRKEVKIRKGEKTVSKPQAKAVDFMLLLDRSGSMAGEPIAEAKKACHALLNEMIDFSVHSLGLIAFDNMPKLLCQLTQDKNALNSQVESIIPDGGTNVVGPLKLAYQELEKSKNERVIVLVTDGYPFDEDAAVRYANKLKKAGIRIISIGVGMNLKSAFLKNIANKDDAYQLANMSELRDTFKTVILKIMEK